MSFPRVLWTHNFDPTIPNSGAFMYHTARALGILGSPPDMLYLGNLRSPAGIRRARGLLLERADAYDVIHCQFGSASAIVTAAVKDKPKVLTVRGSDWTPAQANSLRWKAHGVLAHAMTERALKDYDLVIPVSHRLAQGLRRRRPHIQIEVIPSAVDLELFRPIDRNKAREHLGIEGQGNRFAMFTVMPRRENHHKRPDLARAAVNEARKTFPELKLLVVSGVEQSQIPYYAALCDVALCTSFAEGWPNSIKEALACGVPFVSTDVSDLARIAQDYPPCEVVEDTPDALGAAICRVLSCQSSFDVTGAVRHMGLIPTAQRHLEAYQALVP